MLLASLFNIYSRDTFDVLFTGETAALRDGAGAQLHEHELPTDSAPQPDAGGRVQEVRRLEEQEDPGRRGRQGQATTVI